MCPEKWTVKKAPVKAPFGDSVKINRVSRFVRFLIVFRYSSWIILGQVFNIIFMVFNSKNTLLISDFKRKILGFYKIKPVNILVAVIIFIAIIVLSILLSTFFGQSLNQFSFTEDFSFTGAGIGSAFLTILLASVIEEVGWRGYGEDSIAQYCSWFKESIIFGFV